MFSPPNPAEFNAAVYAVVRQVPFGRVTTYGAVARLILPPDEVDPAQYARLGARWVGNALAGCPADVPWQRVINAQGQISLKRGGRTQQALLEAEGVVFGPNEKVDLQRYGWPDSK